MEVCAGSGVARRRGVALRRAGVAGTPAGAPKSVDCRPSPSRVVPDASRSPASIAATSPAHVSRTSPRRTARYAVLLANTSRSRTTSVFPASRASSSAAFASSERSSSLSLTPGGGFFPRFRSSLSLSRAALNAALSLGSAASTSMRYLHGANPRLRCGLRTRDATNSTPSARSLLKRSPSDASLGTSAPARRSQCRSRGRSFSRARRVGMSHRSRSTRQNFAASGLRRHSNFSPGGGRRPRDDAGSGPRASG